MKPERERSVCCALLRSLGIQFSPSDVTSSKVEPPDVIFRTAQFEILEVMDENRRRHDEWKAEARRRKEAKSLGDLIESYSPPVPMSHQEVVDLVTMALARKSSKYSKNVCAVLDALVYIDLKNRSLDPNSPFSAPSTLIGQGWRSVSLVMTPYGHVLHAKESAPEFLRVLVCQAKRKWGNVDTIFEL